MVPTVLPGHRASQIILAASRPQDYGRYSRHRRSRLYR